MSKSRNTLRDSSPSIKRCLEALIVGTAFLGTGTAQMSAQTSSPSPGSIIENQATGSFVNPANRDRVEIESNLVQVTVAEVAGVTLTSAGIQEADNTVASPGPNQGNGSLDAEDVVYFLFTATNVGNDPTQFFIPGQPSSLIGGRQASAIEIIAVDPDGLDGATEPTDLSSLPVTIRPEGNNTGDATALGLPVGALPAGGMITIRVPVKLDAGLSVGDTASVVLGDTGANDNSTATQNQSYIASTLPNSPSNGFDFYTHDNTDTDGIAGEANGTPLNGDLTFHRQEASALGSVTISAPSSLDYGDAPDTGVGTAAGNYQTTAADSGAAHIINPNLFIGVAPDADDGTQQNINADVDDTFIVADEGDIMLPALDASANSYTLSDIAVTNNTGNTANLVAWIDFDQSGTFDDDEAQTVVVPNTGSQALNLTWADLTDISPGNTYVRFRLTTDAGIAPTGDAANSRPITAGGDGEVEDYLLTITGVAIAHDLEVTKTVSDPSPYEGGATVYTITARNVGNNPLTGIALRDSLPLSVLHVSHTASQGSYDTATGIWTLGNLASNESAILTIVVTVFSGTAGSTITNTASLEQLTQTDENSTNDSDSVDIVPLSTAGGIPPAVQPTNVCFPIADAGALAGSGGDDRLTRFNKITEEEEGVGDGTGTNNIEAGALQPGTGIYYAVNQNELGTLDFNTGQFTGYGSPISAVNGFVMVNGSPSQVEIASSSIDVDGMSFDPTTGILYGSLRLGDEDLLIQIDISTGDHVPDAFGPGEDFVVIQARDGLEDVDGIAVNITGRLYGVVNAGDIGPQRIVEINKVTGATTDVGLVGNDLDLEGLSFDFQGNLYATSGTLSRLYQINLADASILQTWDLNVGSDYEAVSCVLSPSDLGINKTIDQLQPKPGDSATYTLTVTNSGTSLASGIEVTDALPAGVTYSGSSPSQGNYESGSGVWDVGALDVGETATLQIMVTVDTDAAGIVTNTAEISASDQPDINPTNNEDTVKINLGQPEVILVKRITAINGQSTNPNDGTVLDLYVDGSGSEDEHPYWPSSNGTDPDLFGAITAGVVAPGDEVEYTIYFLSTGNEPANNVLFCDRVPDKQIFISDSFNSLTPDPAGVTGENRGIEVFTNGASRSYTNIGGDDTAQFYPPESGLPPACNISIPNTEHNGAIVVELGSLPSSTGAGIPITSNGFIRFRAKVDE